MLPCQLRPKVFFPEDGAGFAPAEAYEEAKDLCYDCPRMFACAEDGSEERFGVWGATSPHDRGTVYDPAIGAREANEIARMERDARILTLAADGVEGAVIADTIGVHVRTIRRVIARNAA